MDRCAAVLIVILAGWALACASTPAAPSGVEVQDLGEVVRAHEPVLGPGTVFETVADAAIDGLAWCYLNSRKDDQQRVRGGSIHPVENGYTYDTVVSAPTWRPDRVQILVKPGDVAYFIQIPAPGTRQDEHHSQVHRDNVDELDPLHRPSYLLTPRLNVQVYTGEGQENQVATLDARELRELARRSR